MIHTYQDALCQCGVNCLACTKCFMREQIVAIKFHAWNWNFHAWIGEFCQKICMDENAMHEIVYSPIQIFSIPYMEISFSCMKIKYLLRLFHAWNFSYECPETEPSARSVLEPVTRRTVGDSKIENTPSCSLLLVIPNSKKKIGDNFQFSLLEDENETGIFMQIFIFHFLENRKMECYTDHQHGPSYHQSE